MLSEYLNPIQGFPGKKRLSCMPVLVPTIPEFCQPTLQIGEEMQYFITYKYYVNRRNHTQAFPKARITPILQPRKNPEMTKKEKELLLPILANLFSKKVSFNNPYNYLRDYSKCHLIPPAPNILKTLRPFVLGRAMRKPISYDLISQKTVGLIPVVLHNS